MRFKGARSSAPAFGPYSGEVAHGSIYWSPVLEGETGIIELALPGGVSPAGTVSLPMISHLVVAGNALRQADPLGQIGQAGACEVDIACMSTSLRQQAASAVNAVARMVVTDQGQTFLCGGTQLNDSITSFTPYYFTANHCLDNLDTDVAASKAQPAAAAATINNYWFFQTSVCGQDIASDVNFVLVAGGAQLLGRSVDYDWALVRLNDPPPAGATFAAWNASTLSAGGHRGRWDPSPGRRSEEIQPGDDAGYPDLQRRKQFCRDAVDARRHRARQQRQRLIHVQREPELL